MQFSIQNLGLTVPQQQKPQGYFTSVGSGMGMGERHDPADGATDVRFAMRSSAIQGEPKRILNPTPGAGTYDVNQRGAIEDRAPAWRFGTTSRKDLRRENFPGPGDTSVPDYTCGSKTSFSRRDPAADQILLPKKLEELRRKMYQKGDGLGPGNYPIPRTASGPLITFGSRFDSSLRNKSHIRSIKVDGPGPGAHKLPSSIKLTQRHPSALERTTFGTSARDYNELPQNTPAPNRYHAGRFTEAALSYSFSQAPRSNDTQMAKKAVLPGPQTYLNKNELKNQMKQAKSMLGGSLEPGQLQDNGVPGPGAYNQQAIHPIKGFVIVPHSNNAKRDTVEVEKMARMRDVGPHSYYPKNPSLARTDNLKMNSIGNAQRQDLIQKSKVPGPGNYVISGDFDKPQQKFRFHMGQKTQNFMGKNLDMPGPGEYETDVIPIHHSNVAHFVGTSVRSDLGVGKAYMYPGPGEYEAPIDSTMDPRIRIAGTFGTQKKDTVLKKNFAPGPGSYDLPNSVGLIPQYLRTEENKQAKLAAEAALRARLEI